MKSLAFFILIWTAGWPSRMVLLGIGVVSLLAPAGWRQCVTSDGGQ
ncbi:MAG: hypothetical protein GX621_18050 [Pirellulaceae bacterium]|nr:hypothetical protein [Pirellulaceae bacterium]